MHVTGRIPVMRAMSQYASNLASFGILGVIYLSTASFTSWAHSGTCMHPMSTRCALAASHVGAALSGVMFFA
jgi:hypothetical protein